MEILFFGVPLLQKNHRTGDSQIASTFRADRTGDSRIASTFRSEQLISAKEGYQSADLPENIPDLMLSYLNELNRDVTEDKLDDRTLHQDAKAIAWERCDRRFTGTGCGPTSALSRIQAASAANGWGC
ncbi:hypothetical protein [Oscillatoria acuminata]|uniref:hypothetical protein n=1 Tax=Oscillatoria acuminata TaxID=118323 RepID=UPI0012EA99E5|nr:hypothetical protein [Oscillatoria acuminata]